MQMKTTLDRFGRLLIPKKIRVDLGISPGDALEIEPRDEGILIKPIQDEPHLVDKEGVLVFSGTATGDIVGAVRKHRKERISRLSSSEK